MLKTALTDFHRGIGAKLVEFAGWEMPVMYGSIVDEHQWTRRHASFFDVSHMGRIEFRGPDAERFLQHLNTRNLAGMATGLSRYSHVCREDGGILDDVIVSRCPEHFLMVCNASNREKLLGWFERQKRGFDVSWIDRTTETAMIAIQGPEAIATMDQILPFPVSDLKRYHFKSGAVFGHEYLVARSGYTGEDGVEVILPARVAVAAVQMMLGKSEELGRPIHPAGLGARDTLRLEAAMPLYGHELTEDWDSLTAGQAWCVDLTKDFVGQPVLKRLHAEGLKRRIVGFELEGKRIARQGAAIHSGGRGVGVVTSGTQSPTFDKVLGMGLIESAAAEPGTRIEIDLRGTALAGKLVPLPFYKRQK